LRPQTGLPSYFVTLPYAWVGQARRSEIGTADDLSIGVPTAMALQSIEVLAKFFLI